MDLEMTLFLIVAVTFGLATFGFSIICYKKQKKDRGSIESTEKQVEDLQGTLEKTRETLETTSRLTAEQSRRIAWLEARVRKPRLTSDEVIDDAATSNEPQKLNITERRHRVISLATRGQHTDSIASTLGMLPGEVELIVNLNHAAAAAAHR